MKRCWKTPYESKRLARKVMREMETRGGNSNGMVTYECSTDHIGYWHIGHEPLKKNRRK